MKKTTLFLFTAVLFAGSLNAQNKALKLTFEDASEASNVAHIEECATINEYISEDPDTNMVVNADGNWTVEVWVKPSEILENKILLSGGNTQFRLQQFTGHPGDWWAGTDFNAVGFGTCLRLEGGEFDEVFGDPGYISEADEWQHLAIVNDKWSVTLYVNGEDEYTMTNYHNADEDFTGYDAPAWGIGDNGTGWITNADCEMDNYRVWTTARTKEEIAADMSKVVPTSTTDLLANYTFDNDEEGKIINTAGDTRNMVISEDVATNVTYVESTAPVDAAGLQALAVVNVAVYPNPASETLRFKTPVDFTGATATVYNLVGQNVLTISKLNNNTMNVSQLKSGIYSVKVNRGNEMFTANFCIQ